MSGRIPNLSDSCVQYRQWTGQGQKRLIHWWDENLEQDSVARLLTTVLVCRVGCRTGTLGLGMLLVRTGNMSVKCRQEPRRDVGCVPNLNGC